MFGLADALWWFWCAGVQSSLGSWFKLKKSSMKWSMLLESGGWGAPGWCVKAVHSVILAKATLLVNNTNAQQLGDIYSVPNLKIPR